MSRERACINGVWGWLCSGGNKEKIFGKTFMPDPTPEELALQEKNHKHWFKYQPEMPNRPLTEADRLKYKGKK